MSWPTLVLTAGLGTRLRPLSCVRAKPAMPVAGEPIVRRVLRWLAAGGITDVVLNLHHRPETICAVVGDGSDLGLRVRYSLENPVLGSAGGPRRALPLIEADRFFIVNGDTITDLDLGALAAEHQQSGALVTLAVVPNRWPERYGGVLADDRGAVTRFTGRGGATPSWHFIGVQAVEARAFAGVRPDEPTESVASLYPALIERQPGSVRIAPCDASFADIGRPADYLATSLAFAEQAAAGPSSGSPRRSPLAGARCRIAPSARITRSVLWDDVAVGDGAVLTECIVADGVEIPDGARFTRRVVVRAGSSEPAPGEETVDNLLVAPIDSGPASSQRERRRTT